jgi:hypothetical protein
VAAHDEHHPLHWVPFSDNLMSHASTEINIIILVLAKNRRQ